MSQKITVFEIKLVKLKGICENGLSKFLSGLLTNSKTKNVFQKNGRHFEIRKILRLC